MPRGKSNDRQYEGPPEEDLAEFRKLLNDVGDAAVTWPLADGSIGRLVQDVTAKGYAMRIAPVLGGSGRAVTIYVGEPPVQKVSSDPDAFEEVLRSLLLAVQKLPRRRG